MVVWVHEQQIQPAAVLVNVHRAASPDDPPIRTRGQLMGALSADQLAR